MNLNSKWGGSLYANITWMGPWNFCEWLKINIYIVWTRSCGIMKLAAFCEQQNKDISACLKKQ